MTSLNRYPAGPVSVQPNSVVSWGDATVVTAAAQPVISPAKTTDAQTVSVEDLKGDAVDALEEFLNVVNGLYIVELANRKIEPNLDFPLANEDVIPRGSHQLLLRVYTEAGDFILVLSTDAFL